METIDDEPRRSHRLHEAAVAGQAFFTWMNTTRMHLRTHVRASHASLQARRQRYVDGMLEHDDTIGTLLKALDDMGIANNTIVVYSSDNAHT